MDRVQLVWFFFLAHFLFVVYCCSCCHIISLLLLNWSGMMVWIMRGKKCAGERGEAVTSRCTPTVRINGERCIRRVVALHSFVFNPFGDATLYTLNMPRCHHVIHQTQPPSFVDLFKLQSFPSHPLACQLRSSGGPRCENQTVFLWCNESFQTSVVWLWAGL